MNADFSNRLKKAIAEFGTLDEFSAASGIPKRTLSGYIAGESEPNISKATRIAEICNVSLEYLVLGTESPIVQQVQQMGNLIEEFKSGASAGQLPIMGTAAGSIAGAMAFNQEPIDWVAAPPVLMGAKDAYALYVVGNSMASRYLPGDLIFVHPHRPVRQGDYCVIQTQNGNGDPAQAWLKQYGHRTDSELIARQLNPEAEVKLKLANVIAVHHVMTPNELAGV